MSLTQLTSPTAVKLAIEECNRIGRDDFLRHWDFGRSREYPLSCGGVEYDSKAIAGVAHGYQFPEQGALRSEDFSGGIHRQGAAHRLSKLGFHVVGVDGRTGSWSLEECELAVEAYFECLRPTGSNVHSFHTFFQLFTAL
jgi:hypothetical protein